MNAMAHHGSPDDSRNQRGWFERLLFAATLLTATLVYLATKSPAIAAILPCLRGGWTTLRTGIWLFRTDSNRPRARTCFAFYLAAACWRAAAVALASVGLAVVVVENFGVRLNPNEFYPAALVTAAGIAINTLLGLGAVCAALACRVRVWVHPRLRQATGGDLRRVDRFGPRARVFNHAVFVVGTALALPAVALGLIPVAVVTVGQNARVGDSGPAMALLLAVVFGVPFAMIPFYAWLSSRIIAHSPQECWPDMVLYNREARTTAGRGQMEHCAMQCTIVGCHEMATFHLTRVVSRRCAAERHLCEQHAHAALAALCQAVPREHSTMRGILAEGRQFDIELIVTTESRPEQVVYLREAGGGRSIAVATGIGEAISLERGIRGFESARPSTHEAMALIVRALGAEIQDVLVDRWENRVFHAKVRMRHRGGLAVVDLQPGDALTLAVAFGCPIRITDQVLVQLR